MSSPGHRINMLADDITHVGIGAVFGEPETKAAGAPRPVFLTQNFYGKPGAEKLPADLAGTVRREVDEVRKSAGIGPVRWDQRVARVAQMTADDVASGGGRFSDDEQAERVYALGYASLERRRVEAGTWRALSTLDLWKGKLDAHVGIGVAPLPAKKGGGVVMIVFLVRKDG